MSALKRFLRFWWTFFVGDDWRVAVGVAIAFGLSAVLARVGIAAWWVLPLAAVAVLAESLRRAAR